MEVLQIFDLLDQEIGLLFTNHKSLIPTLPYTIPLFFIYYWIPED